MQVSTLSELLLPARCPQILSMKKFFVLILVALCVSSEAQDKIDSASMDPVEIKAIRAGRTAPFAKTNLSKKEIQRQNLGQDLPFLLNQTPSAVVNSDAGNGVGYTGIRIRGTDPTRINITLNGIPYNDAESQGSFFVDLPDFASSINSIQIQRGVGTSTNGAGAFGATINFGTNEVNKQAYGEANNSFGSFNTWKNTIRAGTGLIGGHFTADLRLSHISSDGYIDRASSNLRSIYFSTAYLSGKTDLRFNIFSGKEKTYQAWYGISESDLKTSRTINYAGTEKPGEPYDDETDNYRQDHYQLFFNHKINSKLSIQIATFLSNGKGYYGQYKADEDYADYGMKYPIKNNDTVFTTDLTRQLWLDNHFYGTVFSLQHQSEKTQIIFGGAVTAYDGKHFGEVTWAAEGITGPSRWYDLDAFKNDANVYGKWKQDLSKNFELFTDLQYRRVNYDLNGFQDHPALFISNTYDFINPKLGFTYHKNNWLAYASYSIANKEPNRDDFEAGLLEQPKPEHLGDVELGLENKKNKTTWSMNLYYMNYKDQLVLTGKINDVGAYTRINIPDSYRMGLELQASSIFNKWLRASGNISFSRNKIKEFTEYLDDYDNGGQKTKSYSETDISFSPSVTAAATLTLTPVKGFDIDLLSKYVSKQYLDNTSNESRKLNAYFTEDIRAIYSFNKNWLKNIDLVFQVNNLFDKKYEPNGYSFSYYYNNQLTTENYYFPMAGRNYMAGVNLKF
jgi:iron complex outermembrane receptor protein